MLPLPQPSPKSRPRKSMAYTQATEIQDLLRESAHNPKMQGVPLASIARAWLELERLKREIRMKPKPKPIDVVPKSRYKSNSYSDPTARTTPPKRTTIAQVVPQPSTSNPSTETTTDNGQPTPTED
jgi:hypothetical protein